MSECAKNTPPLGIPQQTMSRLQAHDNALLLHPATAL